MNGARKRILVGLAVIVAVVSCTVRYAEPLPEPGTAGPGSEILGVILTDSTELVFKPEQEATWQDTALMVVTGRTDTLHLPRAQIDQLLLGRVDAGRTVLGVGATVGVAAAVLAVAVVASSCPILYAWNGTRYVAVAEPLGGAVSAGLARTDLSLLEGLRPADGELRLLLVNELEETQHLDELSLVAVDHPEGTRVVPDATGRLLRIGREMEARSARGPGGSLLDVLGAVDDRVWESRFTGTGPGAGHLRDTLVFEFPRPVGDEGAVLLVHGGTSQRGAESLRRMLEMWGEEVDTWYDMLDNSAVTRAANEEWVLREELWALKVWVEEAGGWAVRNVVIGGGPLIAETQAVPLDLGGVEGETVRVRLHPPRGYWSLDRVAMGWGVEEVTGTELKARMAEHTERGDVRDLLAEVDGSYLLLPERGEVVELRFPAPPPPAPGLQRTVFSRTHGFYRIHLDATGPRQAARLDSLWLEPGYAVPFSEMR